MLLGIGVLTYPAVSRMINKRSGSYAIAQLQQEMDNTDTEKMARERIRAEEYNRNLLTGSEPASEDDYAEILNYHDGMMGYIRIPKIHVDLPIYHGVGEEVLAKGVGHLPESAIPVGGAGNHAVLTGHTGLPSAELFTELTELEEGDTFHIVVLGEVMTYQVDQIKVVLPSEGRDLMPVAGEDLCTLVTCTPYGINSHRLLVRGHRTETPPAVAEPEPQDTRGPVPWEMILLTVVLVAGFAITVVLILRKNFG